MSILSAIALPLYQADISSCQNYTFGGLERQAQKELGFFGKPAKVTGVSFDELVDRLLAPNMSVADRNFTDIFLCFFRKFAAPIELFSAILVRLESVADDKSVNHLTRTASQLRIIDIAAKWVSIYPGDFAYPSTKRRLEAFITHLGTEPVFAVVAQKMRSCLHHVVEDDDTGWARTDADIEGSESEYLQDGSSNSQPSTDQSFSEKLSKLQLGQGELSADRRPSKTGSVSSSTHETESTAPLAAAIYNSVEDYEREAATMIPTGTLPLDKNRYRIFMDIPDDEVADEITRIDWVLFSSIRVRDLVRHFSLPPDQKEKCKSLQNVNRMINHFNHIARWVANMILIHDKAKRRALMVGKFISIALKLRHLNNYNGLAAVMAGVNGTAIHRLRQTRALIPKEVQRRFARLSLLMGNVRKKFGAYHLAWENSPLPRIPFVAAHRLDLVSAAEASQTFVGAKGDRINWEKFEVILGIMESQGTSYPNLARNLLAYKVIMDCRIPLDDEVRNHCDC
ncbi:ras guanine nucleotide exchange factor domain-containing protein [Diplogelasinospora grovesii]|uniref:Ras guanine nucleotide exchange factor domain-containing protein n=1 Tax=Diplogelasinospora grovesii TaxID=303347 RepID=A0AAN6MZT4_9PEZI|nr:ras guanine nucleotide exchange factor domain-containing protein [Diplogelasinospora grovesii]